MLVVADTTPINYLILIGEPHLLSRLFSRVVLPEAVFRELQNAATPPLVRHWMAAAPAWIEIRQTTLPADESLSHLDEGERQAIQLATELKADLLLADEKAARDAAGKRHLAVTGTLGILDRAADNGWLDFAEALQRLQQTSFHLSPAVERFFLNRDAQRKASLSENSQ